MAGVGGSGDPQSAEIDSWFGESQSSPSTQPSHPSQYRAPLTAPTPQHRVAPGGHPGGLANLAAAASHNGAPQQHRNTTAGPMTLPPNIPSAGFSGIKTERPGGGLASLHSAAAPHVRAVPTSQNPALQGAALPSSSGGGPTQVKLQPQHMMNISSSSSSPLRGQPTPVAKSTYNPTLYGEPPAAKKHMASNGTAINLNSDGDYLQRGDSHESNVDEEEIISKHDLRHTPLEPNRFGKISMTSNQINNERKKDELRLVVNREVVLHLATKIAQENKMLLPQKTVDLLTQSLQARIESIMKDVIEISKRRIDPDKDRLKFVISSNPRKYLAAQDAKKREEKEEKRRQMEVDRKSTPAAKAASQSSSSASNESSAALLSFLNKNPPKRPSLMIGSPLPVGSDGSQHLHILDLKESQRKINAHVLVLYLLDNPHTKSSPLTLRTLAGLSLPDPVKMPPTYGASSQVSSSHSTMPSVDPSQRSRLTSPAANQIPTRSSPSYATNAPQMQGVVTSGSSKTPTPGRSNSGLSNNTVPTSMTRNTGNLQPPGGHV